MRRSPGGPDRRKSLAGEAQAAGGRGAGRRDAGRGAYATLALLRARQPFGQGLRVFQGRGAGAVRAEEGGGGRERGELELLVGQLAFGGIEPFGDFVLDGGAKG